MTEDFEDEMLHYILMDKRKKMIGGRRMYDWYGKKYPHINAPLEYHGEPWDFAFAEPGRFVRLFKEQDGEFYGIETNWRDPRTAGPIAAQKKKLILDWLKIGQNDEEIRTLSHPPFGTQSFEECKTDAELLTRVASGHWPRGKAFYIDNICFINRQDGGDGDWMLLKGKTVVFERFQLRDSLRAFGVDQIQEFIEGIRCADDQHLRKLDREL